MGMTPLLYYQSLSQCTHWATTPCSLALIHPKIHHSPNIQSNLDIAVHGSPGIWRWREAVGACRYEDTCLDAMVYTTLALNKFSSTYSWEICQYRHMDQGVEEKHCIDHHSCSPPPPLFCPLLENTQIMYLCTEIQQNLLFSYIFKFYQHQC